MKAPKALPTGILLAVCIIIVLLDNHLHGGATWWSHAAFWPTLVVFAWAVYGAFTNESKGRV